MMSARMTGWVRPAPDVIIVDPSLFLILCNLMKSLSSIIVAVESGGVGVEGCLGGGV